MITSPFSYGSMDKITTAQWERLSQEKIFFGHKSVGNNIINGMQEVLKNRTDIRLNIIKTEDPSEILPGVFAHSTVGKNRDPQSKIMDFTAKMNNGIGGRADIAFFKFCFVDITASSDVNSVFSAYRESMSELKKVYPQTTFIHVTVPLMWRQPFSFKGIIKRMLGKGGDSDNVARNAYNELLRTEYQGKEPVFDLARLEATRPDGTAETFTSNGKNLQAMVPEYTDDGGHLSARGKHIMAEQLLVFLAELKK